MYSSRLQQYIHEIGLEAGVEPGSIQLLERSLVCFVNILGRLIGAETEQSANLLELSLQVLLLDEGLAEITHSERLEGMHYLVGLGLEQSGELLARADHGAMSLTRGPLENDHWYRLLLAFLHYLAGGHRIQALSVANHLRQVASWAEGGSYRNEYAQAQRAVEVVYAGGSVEDLPARWRRFLSSDSESLGSQEQRIRRLARKIYDRRDVVAGDLGRHDEAEWLSRRAIDRSEAAFWSSYLNRLQARGITTFTDEQIGPRGFDAWLQPRTDLLVVLPTGAGKTIVGELRAALTLAQRRQVLWMIPTRALVRQTKRTLRRAFEPLGVRVEELPTTEDFVPAFATTSTQPRSVAATTPEKLAALLRAHPDAVENVGLVVLDEAQVLRDESRGTTAEFVLQQIRQRVPQVDIVLMTAALETSEVLGDFLTALGREPERLVSNWSLTRYIYGVVTDDGSTGRSIPKMLLYPPGHQRVEEATEDPISLALTDVSLPSQPGPLRTAQSFIKGVAPSGIRSVLFVGRKDLTETQAKAIARVPVRQVDLPENDVSRLRVELGRPSVIEETCQKGVAPHHAGLTPLEQHTVEQWVLSDLVGTVIATSTLAQGVNLPFDLAVVSFLSRFDKTRRHPVPLSQTELLNMLGRAGRAGYLSDAVCLLSIKSGGREPVETLDEQRHIFFRPREPVGERIGLSRLISVALNTRIDSRDWLMELSGASFSEVQALVAFTLRATAGERDVREALIRQMAQFPSVQEITQTEITRAAMSMEGLQHSIEEVCAGEHLLVNALQRTGMPLQVLRRYLSNLRSAPSLLEMDTALLLEWTDELVHSALDDCSSRGWFQGLVEDAELDPMFRAISLWREGRPVAHLETSWDLTTSTRARGRSNRIKIGEFLNHRLSLFAQFWGAIVVCEEELRGPVGHGRSGLAVQLLPTFIREGVASVHELAWLNAIGGMDRVLAHALGRGPAPTERMRDLRESIGQQLRKWSRSPETVAIELEAPFRLALYSVLDEIARESVESRA